MSNYQGRLSQLINSMITAIPSLFAMDMFMLKFSCSIYDIPTGGGPIRRAATNNGIPASRFLAISIR